MKYFKKSTNVRLSAMARGLIARLLAPIAPGAAAHQVARLFMTVPKTPAPEREADWIADARSEVVAVNGRRIRTLTWGDAGPTVLLVHGWGGRGSQLGAFVAPLRRRGLRVVGWDGPAHGGSSGRRTTLPELSAVTEAMLRRWRPNALVAHSLGATATTLAFARGAPECRSLFLAAVDDAGPFLDRVGGALGLPPEIAWLARVQIERQIGQSWRYLVASRVAPWMGASLLILHDEEDSQVPVDQAEKLARAWPGSRLERTCGLGHQRILRDPDVVRRGTAFLTEAQEPVQAGRRVAHG